MKTVYISIGNSDDKLTQRAWAAFYGEVDEAIQYGATTIHGAWQSITSARWQNACWCIEILDQEELRLKLTLRKLAAEYGQDSIAWAEARTEFLEALT